jgi:hypothetical protein
MRRMHRFAREVLRNPLVTHYSTGNRTYYNTFSQAIGVYETQYHHHPIPPYANIISKVSQIYASDVRVRASRFSPLNIEALSAST